MPYDEESWQGQPPPAVLAAASRYRIDRYREIKHPTMHQIKSHLLNDTPVLIGIPYDQSFVDLKDSSIWRRLDPMKVRGLHAMVVVGFSTVKRAFRVINSWGPKWADSGFVWIDYDHLVALLRTDDGMALVVDDARNAVGSAPTYRLAAVAIESFTFSKPLLSAKQRLKARGTMIVSSEVDSARTIVRLFAERSDTLVPVYSLDGRFAIADGEAAIPSEVYLTGGKSRKFAWSAEVPVEALRLSTADGTMERLSKDDIAALVAVPELFTDNLRGVTGRRVKLGEKDQ
jgi:hypothetical protein